VKFLVDANLAERVARLLQGVGHEPVHVRALDMGRALHRWSSQAEGPGCAITALDGSRTRPVSARQVGTSGRREADAHLTASPASALSANRVSHVIH
jgi:hypothetical protein